jgi:putative DNA primase/helicase
LLLSSGELSLSEYARSGGNKRLLGEEVRFIDVPVPAKPTGVFDRLPRRRPAQTSGVVAKRLEKWAARTYGVAGKTYLEKLVADCGANRRALRNRLYRYRQRFLQKIGVDADDGYADRFAKRFALTYAAGLLAIDYGIVPWKRSLVGRCVRRVYRQAMSMRSSADESLEGAVAKVLGHLPRLLKHAVDIKKCTRREGRRAAESESPLRLVHTDGHPLIALRPAVLKKIIGTAIPDKAVAAELERRGLLISRGKRRRTRQVRVPGVAERHGYYCLRLQIGGPKYNIKTNPAG